MARRKRSCKWGRRVHGYCPRKPRRPRHATKKKASRGKRRVTAPRMTAVEREKLTPVSNCPTYVWSRATPTQGIREICLAYLMKDGKYRCRGGLTIAGEEPVSEYDITASDVESVYSTATKGCPPATIKRTA